jgi:hypothetical protein
MASKSDLYNPSEIIFIVFQKLEFLKHYRFLCSLILSLQSKQEVPAHLEQTTNPFSPKDTSSSLAFFRATSWSLPNAA